MNTQLIFVISQETQMSKLRERESRFIHCANLAHRESVLLWFSSSRGLQAVGGAVRRQLGVITTYSVAQD